MGGEDRQLCDSLTTSAPPPTFRANAYAERLRLGLAVIHGEPKDIDTELEEDGRYSPPPQGTEEQLQREVMTPSKSGRVVPSFAHGLDIPCAARGYTCFASCRDVGSKGKTPS